MYIGGTTVVKWSFQENKEGVHLRALNNNVENVMININFYFLNSTSKKVRK